MQTIDETQLESDLQQRFDFLADFIGFNADDVRAIQAFAPHLGPQIPNLVDQTYDRLLRYDATARHFAQPQHGFDGKASSVTELTSGSPPVQFRKDHLNRYFMQLIGRSYDAKMVLYLDTVGKMHTSQAGNQAIVVPLVQMNALMGLMADLLADLILNSPIEANQKSMTLRAFQKVLWIQNDFINRHYAQGDGLN